MRRACRGGARREQGVPPHAPPESSQGQKFPLEMQNVFVNLREGLSRTSSSARALSQTGAHPKLARRDASLLLSSPSVEFEKGPLTHALLFMAYAQNKTTTYICLHIIQITFRIQFSQLSLFWTNLAILPVPRIHHRRFFLCALSAAFTTTDTMQVSRIVTIAVPLLSFGSGAAVFASETHRSFQPAPEVAKEQMVGVGERRSRSESLTCDFVDPENDGFLPVMTKPQEAGALLGAIAH